MITEIVGLAGVGKSTITQTVSQRDSSIQCGFSLKRMEFYPAFFAKAVLSLPGYLNRHHTGTHISWEALRIMAYLDKLYRVLSKHKSSASAVFLLDQGPIFLLAYLRQFSFNKIKEAKYESWWQETLELWVSTLDIIFWLDAPDTVLLERIRQRGSWHRVKDMSEQDALAFLACYRETYWQIIPQFLNGGSGKIHKFDSNEESVNHIVDTIIDEVKTGRAECQN